MLASPRVSEGRTRGLGPRFTSHKTTFRPRMNVMFRRLTRPGLLALTALAVSACGGGDEGYRFEVHPADGKVIQQGKPVPKAFVRFHPTDPKTVAIPEGKTGPPVLLTTETDAEGKFSLSTYVADDGVPAGDYKVTVAIGLAEADVENADVKRGAATPKTLAVGKIYRDPATTPLKATVKPGENHFTFELE